MNWFSVAAELQRD